MEIINATTISIMIFFIGFIGLLNKRNIVKSIICLGIMQAGIILFFIADAFVPGSVAPIDTQTAALVADPLPQALMLTEIVIGVGVTATALILFIHLYYKYGTISWDEAAKKRMDAF